VKLAIGHRLTNEGRQAVGILDGLFQTVGLPNIPPLRAYVGLKRAGMAPAQIFCDNPSLEDGVSHWLTSGAAQQWIAQEQRRMHGKANGKPPAPERPLAEVAPARHAAARTVALVEPVDEPFSRGGG